MRDTEYPFPFALSCLDRVTLVSRGIERYGIHTILKFPRCLVPLPPKLYRFPHLYLFSKCRSFRTDGSGLWSGRGSDVEWKKSILCHDDDKDVLDSLLRCRKNWFQSIIGQGSTKKSLSLLGCVVSKGTLYYR